MIKAFPYTYLETYVVAELMLVMELINNKLNSI